MKLKNVKVGGLVEAKVDIVKRRVVLDDLVVPSGTICKVVNKEHADYTSRLSVGIEAEGVKIWCNHKDLRNHLLNLKQLDQSAFDDLDENWQFAATDNDGRAYVFIEKPAISVTNKRFIDNNNPCRWVGNNYSTSNWQNSLIERENVELTGSDLCRAMKNRYDWVLVYVSDLNDSTAEFNQRPSIVTGAAIDGRFQCGDMRWNYAVPINNKGEILTAKDVGL